MSGAAVRFHGPLGPAWERQTFVPQSTEHSGPGTAKPGFGHVHGAAWPLLVWQHDVFYVFGASSGVGARMYKPNSASTPSSPSCGCCSRSSLQSTS